MAGGQIATALCAGQAQISVERQTARHNGSAAAMTKHNDYTILI
jgi:hypothetical protein